MSTTMRPEWRWNPEDSDMVLSAGPVRIYDHDPDDHTPTPVGFTAPLSRVLLIDDTETEPLLWEGDNA